MNTSLRQLALGLACIMVLLAVMALYMQPQFLLTLADQLWGCF